MLRGLYTAASGMMVEALSQETRANNLANSDTAGFKRSFALQRSLPQNMVKRTDNSTIIGSMGMGSLVHKVYTSYEQGGLVQTGRLLDLAIEGEGFFTVETPEGIFLLRSGALSLDTDGFLVTESGYRVLGDGGALKLPEGELEIDEAGLIYVDDVLAGRIELMSFADTAALQQKENGLFEATENALSIPFTGRVHQGFLENANVKVIDEMTRMLTGLRIYEANQRMVQAQDEILGKAVTIGSLR